MELTIYVPAAGTHLGIDPKSAIVGREPEDGRIKVYFEGNRFGAENMRRFTDRLMHAAGRLVQRYPTIAYGWYPEKALVAVGTYDAANWRITAIHNADALQQWLENEPMPEVFNPTEPRFVIYAPSEGFWSNEEGWGDVKSATRFSETERQAIDHLPLAKGGDVRWLDAKTGR